MLQRGEQPPPVAASHTREVLSSLAVTAKRVPRCSGVRTGTCSPAVQLRKQLAALSARSQNARTVASLSGELEGSSRSIWTSSLPRATRLATDDAAETRTRGSRWLAVMDEPLPGHPTSEHHIRKR